jgi:hypothetical protein
MSRLDTTIRTCRFCHKSSFDADQMLRYGPRHNAHFACYLDSGKKLSDLKPWQVERFPWRLLHDRGLLDEAARVCGETSQ